jgi:hypothetical protein
MMSPILQSIFIAIARLMVWSRPAVPIIFAVLAWSITAMLVLSIVSMVRQGLANVRTMHRIPCANCRYATENYRLKCSVHPVEAFSEQAISCQDFEPQDFSSQDLSSQDFALSQKPVLSNFSDLAQSVLRP